MKNQMFKRMGILFLVISMIVGLTVITYADDMSEKKTEVVEYEGDYYYATGGGDVYKGRDVNQMELFITYDIGYDDMVTDIAVFNNKIILGQIGRHIGYYAEELGWAIYDMDTKLWSGRPSGIPAEFAGDPHNFVYIGDKLQVELSNVSIYGIEPTYYQTSDGIRWNYINTKTLSDIVQYGAQEEIFYGKVYADEIKQVNIEEMNYPIVLNELNMLSSIDEKSLSQELNRAIGITMVMKALGYTQEDADKLSDSCTFTDMGQASWAKGFVSLAYQKGITEGKVPGEIFDPLSTMTKKEFITFFLRALKYNSALSWEYADVLAVSTGMITNKSEIVDHKFTKNDAAEIMCKGLLAKVDFDHTLIEQLISDGIVSSIEASRLGFIGQELSGILAPYSGVTVEEFDAAFYNKSTNEFFEGIFEGHLKDFDTYSVNGDIINNISVREPGNFRMMGVVIGMTSSQIITLLGEPERISPSSGVNSYFYSIGDLVMAYVIEDDICIMCSLLDFDL